MNQSFFVNKFIATIFLLFIISTITKSQNTIVFDGLYSDNQNLGSPFSLTNSGQSFDFSINGTSLYFQYDENYSFCSTYSNVQILSWSGANDEPTLTATSDSPTYIDGLPAQELYSSASASTIESGQTIDQLILTITNITDGSDEILNIDGTDVELTDTNSETTATNSMTAAVSLLSTTATIIISKTGGISTALMQTLINSLAYKNTVASPTTTSRVATITSISDNGSSTSPNDNLNDALSIVSTISITIVSAPTTQAHTVTFSNVGTTQMGVGWTIGNGAKRAVFIAQASSGNASPDDKTTYTANANFGDGDQIGATGWYCIYNGTGTSVTVTGLFPGTTYRVMACEYNGDPSTEKYLTSIASGNPANQEISAVLINEVDADTPGTDNLEFVELFSEDGAVPLDGLVVVFYNGADDQSNKVIGMDGESTDANGYFVLGNSGVAGVDLTFSNGTIQNGPDAVALFVGDESDFPNDTPVTTDGLVDAIVYGNGHGEDAGILPLLNSGQGQVDEDKYGNSPNHSMQRIANGAGGLRNTDNYAIDWPTPGAENTRSPEIGVLGLLNSISDEDITPSTADNTDFGDVDTLTGTKTHTFWIKNTAPGNLELSGSSPYIALQGGQVNDFEVTTIPSTTIVEGDSTKFEITFNPSGLGTRETEVYINSNDRDEGSFNFKIQGNGTVTPDIEVLGNNQVILDNDNTPSTTDSTDFGELDFVFQKDTVRYKIKNTGTKGLTLSGTSPYITLSGTNSADFGIVATPSQTIPAGDSTFFDVEFNPGAVGDRLAEITILSDDPDEGTFNFAIKGKGVESPEIGISGNGNSIPDGDTNPSTAKLTDFGDVDVVTGSITNQFVIANTGSGTLTLDGVSPYVSITGHTADFTLVANPDPSLVSLVGLTYFSIKFNPTATGKRTATISIANNDEDENPYNFVVEGMGIDTTAPEVICSSNQVDYLNAQCKVVLKDYTGLATITDNFDPSPTVVQSPLAGTEITGQGNVSVTIKATDASSNTDSCAFIVQVLDTTNPTATCSNTSVYLDANGEATITPAMVDNGSSDACGIASLQLDSTNFDCSEVGANTVVLTVTDNNSNESTCSAVITAQDTVSPVAKCTNLTVYLDENGGVDITPAMVNNGSTDACGIASLQLDSTSFDCSEVGSNTVVLAVTDNNTNESTCSAVVTVQDTVSSVAKCTNLTVYLDANGEATITPAMVDNGSTDACGIASLQLDSTNFDCSEVGANTVVLTVTDNNTNKSTCSAVVTVLDTLNPIVLAKKDTVYLGHSGVGSITYSNLDMGSTDNCGISQLSVSKSQFSCSDIGAVASINSLWINEFHYDNASTDVGEFVEIAGTAGIDLSAYHIYLYNGSNGTYYGIESLGGIIPNEKDGFGALSFSISGMQNGPDGLALVEGGNVVEFISYEGAFLATDGPASGILSVDVGVKETTSTSMGFSLQRSGKGNSPGGFEWDGPLAESPGLLNTNQEIVAFEGVEVFLVAEDVNGNVDSSKTLVTVYDTIAPDVYCKNIDVFMDANGEFTITPADIDNGSVDACGIQSLELSRDSFSCGEIISKEALWINEIHYDNASTDINEFVEIAGTAGLSLNGHSIYLYNGSNGEFYDSISISGIIPNEINGYGALAFQIPDIQNGPDGIALVEDNRHVLDFISYEGEVTASNGPATGDVATDIQVKETSSTVVGNSLQLQGAGSEDKHFNWVGPMAESPGLLNVGQQLDTATMHPVTLYVEDIHGNIDSCEAYVTLHDTILPTPVCKDTLVYLDENGEAAISVGMVDNGTFDNCGIYKTRLDNYAVSCLGLDGVTVQLTAEDKSGNKNTCSAYVAIYDTIMPVIQCNDIEVGLWENGQFVFNDVEKLALVEGTTDNCSSFDDLVFGYSNISYNCINVNNPDTITVTATDIYGNTNTCMAEVVVEDVSKPVVGCADIVVELDSTGNAMVFQAQLVVDSLTFDNCQIETMEIEDNLFSCNDLGENSIKLSVYDAAGNKGWCKSTVEVVDNIAPVFTEVENINIMVEPGVCSTTLDNYPEIIATDACNITYSSLEGLGETGEFPLGTTIETWVATDASGNADTMGFTVTISSHNDAPTINAIADITVAEDPALVVVSMSGIGYGDDCGIQDISVFAGADNIGLVENIGLGYTSGSGTGSLSLSIAPDENGKATITVTIKDDGGTANGGVDTKVETFVVTVEPVNDTPVCINPVPDQSLCSGTSLELDVQNALMKVFEDIDGDVLSIEGSLSDADTLPAWATFINNKLILAPGPNDAGSYAINLLATDAGGLTATDQFQLDVEHCTGINGLSENKFDVQMFPNPTKGVVNFEVDFPEVEEINIQVINITGKEILKQAIEAASIFQLDMGSHVSGMYFVKLNVDGNEVVKKLVVDRK